MDLSRLRAAAGVDHVCRAVIRRRPVVEAAYELHKRSVLERYESLEDYILGTVFSCGGATQASSGKFKAQHCEASRWAFTRNPYPYDIAPGLEHWNLWNRSHREDIPGATALITKNFGPEAVWWVNIPANRTIPGLWHAHIFVQSA